MVIDHSVIADVFGTPEAFERNVEIEYERNRERYQFLRWGQGAFDDFKVVPPGTGIVHQVNIEHLARTVFTREVDGVLQAYPDTCVGTDSHTTMVNGIGVVGWGVGGIEAEAAMLGQPVSMLIPRVVGFKLNGDLPEGSTATDLVLTITEMLRKHGVVGKFVEFYGPGVSALPLANRATIGNMSPEFGSTIAVFPIDEQTIDYLTPHRPPRGAARAGRDLRQGAGPLARPRRRAALLREARARRLHRRARASPARSARRTGSRSPRRRRASQTALADYTDDKDAKATISLDGQEFEIGHGAVTIAAITSCTNTSNPSVMIGAALLAKNAVEKGLARKPWVKTTLAPGSKVVSDYYEKSGLTPYLDKLGFNLVGYGCTTCIGNSGPLIPEVRPAVNEADLAVTSVLSGNRNFEGRINPDIKMNYLASPPLVVAYALAGSMDLDLFGDPLGQDRTATTSSSRTSGPRPTEVEDDDRRGDQLRDVRRVLQGRLRRRRALAVAADARGQHVRVGRGLHLRPEVLPTSTACPTSRPRSRTSPAPGCCSSWATRSRPTTSARPARSRRTARPVATSPSTASSSATSTPTARAAATTRS